MFLWNSYCLNEAYIKEGKCRIWKVNVNSKHNIKMNETKISGFQMGSLSFETEQVLATSIICHSNRNK